MDSEVLRDFMGARLVTNNMMYDCYNKMYYRTNENLVDIYLDLKFEGKDVLTVISSGDQVYTPKILGAKSVDCFDVNKLTKYYYYVRKWAILLNKEIYPYGLVDGDLNYLREIIKRVKPNNKEERDALEFWKLIYKNDIKVGNMFYNDYVNDGSTLFENNVNYIKDVACEELNFNHLDFFKPFNSYKKYDYVIMSNIIEHCNGDKERLKIVRDNLCDLLKRRGKVICSSLIYQGIGIPEYEKEIFKEYFKLEDYGPREGYTYSKKQY